MVKRLPVAIREAKTTAERYRICRSRRGYNVWRFRDWSARNSGWRIVAENVSFETALNNILQRLDLERPVKAVEVVSELDFYSWTAWDWG